MTSPGATQLSVLVVEDEFLVATEIAAILEEAGHRVIGPVASVEAAAAVLAAGPKPGIAIIDVNLRGQSAAPIAVRLRELGVPFCVCSGYRSADLNESFGEVTMVQKPVTPANLLHAVAQIVDQHQTAVTGGG
jgi:CheY-like chemotaxis protein